MAPVFFNLKKIIASGNIYFIFDSTYFKLKFHLKNILNKKTTGLR